MSTGDSQLSQQGVQEALTKIKEKSAVLSEKAGAISTAFSNAVQTIQLTWLNNMIEQDWNTTGGQVVSNAQSELAGAVESFKNTAEGYIDITNISV